MKESCHNPFYKSAIHWLTSKHIEVVHKATRYMVYKCPEFTRKLLSKT